jgi:hypothetical protein
MPARQQDDDFLNTLPDTSKTGVPYASAGKPRGRRSTATEDDDFLESMPDTTGRKAYSAADAGSNDSYSLYPDVKVVGRNAAGNPILAPASQLEGSATRRFLRAATDALVGPIKGAYHALVDAPRNEEERAIAAEPWYERLGPAQLIANRTVAQPMKHEAQRTAEEYAGTSTPGFAETPIERTVGTAIHGLGTAVPLLGPAAAEFYEGTRQKYAEGDVGGALGGGVGNVIAYVAPERLGAVARSKWLTESIPHSMVTKMIRPAATDLKFGKNPARAILDEGITGNTLEDIGNKVSDRLGEVGRELDREAQKPANASKVVDVTQSLRPLDDAMVEAVKAGDRQLFRKLQDVRSELSQDWQAVRTPGGRVVMRPTGPRNLVMNPSESLAFKRAVGDRIRWDSDPLSGAVNKSLAAVYGQVRDALNAQVPALRDLNTRYSDLVGATQAVRRRIPAQNRNAAWSLSDIMIGGHNLPLAITRHIARTPAVRSRVASGLYQLPKAVPKHPTLVAAPAIAAAQSGQRDQQ